MAQIDNTELSNHFSARSATYNLHGTWVNNNEVLSQIVEFLPTTTIDPVQIVDLGAGTGAVSMYIYQNYSLCKDLYAVDICPDMLAKFTEPRIRKRIASVESLPFADHSFDVAVSRQCLHYTDDLTCVASEIKRILKGGGTFVLAQIVPLDTAQKKYWEDMIRLRQPLRKHFFSGKEWINFFVSHGFTLQISNTFSHIGSVKKWVKKYNIIDTELIRGYKCLLRQAPDSFKNEYNVIENGDDIIYSSYWIVAKFTI